MHTRFVYPFGKRSGARPGHSALLLTAVLVLTALNAVQAQTPIFINELHYDDAGGDVNEGVEIAGPSGTELIGWSIVPYNGNGGTSYSTTGLDGIFADQCGGFGTINVPIASLQNGAPDGVALVDDVGTVIQFLSYEGSFMASDGPAMGMTSVDIGVQEAGEPDGQSLQLSGTGEFYEDFTWNAPQTATAGNCNTGQTFMPAGDVPPTASIVPANMATDVDPASMVTISFSEVVDVAANAVQFACNSSGTQSFPVAMANDVTQLDLDPVDFDFGETCTVTIVAASVTDNDDTVDPLDGNGDGTGGDDFVSSFTVIAQDPPPTVSSTDPMNGAVGVDGSLDITINFSENIDATASAITLVCDSGPVTHGGLPVTDSNQIVINPDSDLIDAESCTVTAVAAEITASSGVADPLDGDGNGLGGDDFQFSFLVGFPVFEIFEIQGEGLASAFDGQTITTRDNIVTVLDTNGFYIQTPDSRDDANVNTSNALFVFTGGAPTVAVGDQVDVTAQLVEFNGLTEFGTTDLEITIDSSGNPLPAAIVFDENLPSPDPTFSYCNTDLESAKFECLENMLIDIPQAFVGAPYSGFFSSSQRNDILVVRAGSERSFREPGIEFPGLVDLPVWDGNPELFEIFMPGLTLSSQLIPGGSEISAQGVIFPFGSNYQINPSVLTVVDENVIPDPVTQVGPNVVQVGSANLFRLFNDIDDPGVEDDDQIADPIEYQNRLIKISMYIRNDLDAPDILALQEVERLDVLDDLVAQIAIDDPGVVYTPFLIEGNDRGGIDVGFLLRANVSALQVNQLGAAETLSVDGSLLHDRPPLHLQADIDVDGQTMRINLLGVHNRSRGSIDDPSDGARVRQKRLEQANSVAAMVQSIETDHPGEAVVVLGDFNAFQFTDGYVDAIGQITGTAVEDDNLLWTAPVFAAEPLTQAVSFLPAEEQYSFVFRGDAQILDNALMNSEALALFINASFARGNADAPLIFEDDNGTSMRAADHDGLVINLSLNPSELFSDGFED